MIDTSTTYLKLAFATCAVLASAGFLAGCADDEVPASTLGDTPTGTWVGRIDGTDAFVAVVADREQVVGYVCEDGRLAEWFFGDASGSDLVLTSTDGAVLLLSIEEDATGMIMLPDGGVHAYRAAATDAEALYRADGGAGDSHLIGGWIRIGDETRGSITIVGAGITAAPPLGDTVVVAEGILSPAAMTPSTLGVPTANTTKFVWGAMGDSYGAGEGNPELGIADPSKPNDFTGLRWGNDTSIWIPLGHVPSQDAINSHRADVTTCHRSDNAGAPKAHRRLKELYPGVNFVLGFAACSGATTMELRSSGFTGASTRDDSMLGHARVAQAAQLDSVRLLQADHHQLDAVYMSIGGNDVGFAEIVADCVTPGSDCVGKWLGVLPGRLDDLGGRYRQLDSDLRGKLGDGVNVLISEYPNPMDDGGSQAPACQGDDYVAFGETGFGEADDFLKNNVSPEEANFAFGIPAAINAVVRATSMEGWRVVAAPDYRGHGICTGSPFANLNSHAMRTQGHDLEQAIFDISAGLLHPNEAGYQAYANEIVASLKPLVNSRVLAALQPPTGVRIGSAVKHGSLTIHWNDRATAENAYEIEVIPARPQDAAQMIYPGGATILKNQGYVLRVAGVGLQKYQHVATGAGLFKFRVRACNSGVAGVVAEAPQVGCGAFSASITGANFVPSTPTGLTVATAGANSITGIVMSYTWSTPAGTLENVVRIGTTEVRTTGTSLFRFFPLSSTASERAAQVASCNRVGCSNFSATVSP